MTDASKRLVTNWMDYLTMALGFWLFLSPGVLAFNETKAAAWAAFLIGVAVIAISVAVRSKFRVWEEWLAIALGAATVVLPWIVGFAADRKATWNLVACGLAVVALAALRLYTEKLVVTPAPVKAA